MASLRERAVQALEAGTLPRAPTLESLARAWTQRSVARPLTLPADVRTVTVGGATLGGSGRTRVALAATRVLAAEGAEPVLVGHAYRARTRTPRHVGVDDDLDVVGDEAVLCAQALRGTSARVVVGPDRAAAARFAVALGAHVLVFDGPLQLAPRRADYALLAVDASAPWGAGRVVPFGDLRAPPRALLDLADDVVHVDATPSVRPAVLPLGPLGLFTAIARPARLVAGLTRMGVAPAVALHGLDHGPTSARGLRAIAQRVRQAEHDHGLVAWLVTRKCALHLDRAAPSRPPWLLEDAFMLPEAVRSRLLVRARSPRLAAHTRVHGVP